MIEGSPTRTKDVASGPLDGNRLDSAVLAWRYRGRPQRDLLVYLDQDDVYVERDALVEAGLDVRGATIRRFEGDDKEYVSLTSLSAQLTWDLDPDTLVLSIDSSQMPTTRIVVDLRLPRPDMVHTSDTSAFVNYGLQLTDLRSVHLYGEAGMSVRNARLYTSVSLPVGQSAVRGLSNLTVDLRDRLTRLIAGDSVANGGALGGGGVFGGVQLARHFGLDPYFIFTPSYGQMAYALAPSTLEVYVNGRLVDRQQVEPGEIDLRHIPVTNGAGDTEVVLRDALGRAVTFQSSYYRPTRLLARAQDDFALTVGLQRVGLGTSSWNYGVPAALGTYRLGFTDGLTLGARAESSLDRVSGGGGAVFSVGIGQIEVNAAASTAGVPGTAAPARPSASR